MKKKLTTVDFRGTAEQEAKLLEVIAKYDSVQGKMMPILQEAQEIYGYLPIEVQKIIADKTGIPAEQMENVIIAYEPVWAIGTGLTATPEQAEEVCAIIRRVIGELYGEKIAEATTIQYGGSMNDGNAAELLSKVNVDGGLIGGASLVPEKFAKIVDAAQA